MKPTTKGGAEEAPRTCKVKGCKRPYRTGKGAADGACSMHYSRYRRTGSYGDAEGERDEAPKPAVLKVYLTDEDKAGISELAAELGVPASEWAELVLVPAMRRRMRERAGKSAAR